MQQPEQDTSYPAIIDTGSSQLSTLDNKRIIISKVGRKLQEIIKSFF